ncbi:UNVERIFIED_CONTAM: hypothetical protein FKN15_029767 [Acipenser sinensis]
MRETPLSNCERQFLLQAIAEKKVWQIRVDLHLLNHDGNIMDAASIAAITALCHFRRPDVSIQGEDVTVYTPEERDPVPLSIHHMPICVSFSFFQQGTYLLVDPSEREERVMDGLLVIAMNKHREICTIQSSGGIMLLKDQVCMYQFTRVYTIVFNGTASVFTTHFLDAGSQLADAYTPPYSTMQLSYRK